MSQARTVRFDALVESSGQPEQVTLWTKPEEDREFMKAVKHNRVATVVQRNVGTKKDFGVVGFEVKKNAAYLVFPKALSAEKGSKIIGIKYERFAEAEPKGEIFRAKKKSLPGVRMRERSNYKVVEEGTESREKAEPRPFTFRAEVILTATQKTEVKVEAASASAAAKLIRSQAEEVEFDVSAAKIARKIGKAKKVQRKG